MKRIGSLAAVALLLIASADRASAQGRGNRTAAGCPLVNPVQFHECAVPKMKAFDPPRTPDGKPDLQGYWERAFTSQDVEEHGPDGLNTQAGPSLVVDTPDHKIPYQPWALEFRKTIVQRFISPLASCFPPGVPRRKLRWARPIASRYASGRYSLLPAAQASAPRSSSAT